MCARVRYSALQCAFANIQRGESSIDYLLVSRCATSQIWIQLQEQSTLDTIECTSDTREGVRFHTKPLKDGGKEQCKRFLFRDDLSSPASIGDDSSPCLVVVIAPTEFHVTAVGEAEIFATC